MQEVIQQHSVLARLNESSVNPIRVMTLRLNGNIHYLHSTVRFGIPGAITDINFKDGKEIAQLCAVDATGELAGYFYNNDGLKKPLTSLGIEENLYIPNFNKVIDMAIEIHKGLHHFDLVGSDITLNRSGDPIMIEYNVYWPGPIYPQYCNGPLVGEYTEELLKTIRKYSVK